MSQAIQARETSAHDSEIDRQKCHREKPTICTAVHSFLHESCKNASLAHIVFNGHGSRSGLCVHIGENVPLDDIITDICFCFGTIPSDKPPYQVDLVFAQCHGDKYDANFATKNVTVTHLVKTGNKNRTFDSFSKKRTRSFHAGLQDYAEERKERVNNSPKPTGDLESTHL